MSQPRGDLSSGEAGGSLAGRLGWVVGRHRLASRRRAEPRQDLSHQLGLIFYYYELQTVEEQCDKLFSPAFTEAFKRVSREKETSIVHLSLV